MVGDALCDVEAEGDEHLRLDVYGAGEVDVVPVQAVGYRRQHQHLVGGTAADLQTDGLGQQDVGVQGQMSAVLLGRSRGQDDEFLHGNGLVHLLPGEAVVAVLFAGGHR